MLTKKGARSVTMTLDRIANLFQSEHNKLGIPEKIATDFAYRCDLLSGEIEKNAGIDRKALSDLDVMKEPGFDPDTIGEEVRGPLEGDADEPYMKGEFTQQENRELRERVEDNDLGMKTNPEPQTPQAGKQAMRKLAQVLSASPFDSVKAIAYLLPHLTAGSDPTKVAKMINLATKIAEAEKGKIPPQFLENVKKKQEEAGKGEDKEEKKDDDKEEKKASYHGFNLQA